MATTYKIPQPAPSPVTGGGAITGAAPPLPAGTPPSPGANSNPTLTGTPPSTRPPAPKVARGNLPAPFGHNAPANKKGYTTRGVGHGYWQYIKNRPQPHKPAPLGPGDPGYTYGLNVHAKGRFDPFAGPGSQGAFNQEVLNTAAPGYQPQLAQNTADTAAENTASKLRNSNIAGIYKTYGDQTQKAFKETQAALKDMIAQNATGDTQSSGVLNAALNSATGRESQLGAQMGISNAVTPGEVAPYVNAAQGAAQGTGAELKGLSGGLLSTAGEANSNVAMERAQQKNIESQRHGAALQSGRQSRDAIVAGIPALIEKAREELITQLLNAQGLKFQQNLATKQFGLSQTVAAANIANAQGTLRLNEVNSAASRANALTTLKQNQEALDTNARAVRNSAVQAQRQAVVNKAKIQGQREANAVKFLTGFITPTKQELNTTTYTDKNGVTHHQGAINVSTWHRDVGNALKTLMVTYGLSQEEALALMSGITTPIGGGVNMTIGKWASTFLLRQQQQRNIANNPFTQSILGVLHRLKSIFQ